VNAKTETAKPQGLATKMAAAMGEIGRVRKRGQNQAQGYTYARADDVAEEARAVLAKHGIAIYPDVIEYGVREVEAKNGKMRITFAKVAWTFVDGETGESRTINVPGEGQDYGDKGLYKAMTGSMKYLLMTSFLIPTGEGDPEHDSDEEEKPAGRPAAPPKPAQPPPPKPDAPKSTAPAYVAELWRRTKESWPDAAVAREYWDLAVDKAKVGKDSHKWSATDCQLVAEALYPDRSIPF
jgi:hypothetical protein